MTAARSTLLSLCGLAVGLLLSAHPASAAVIDFTSLASWGGVSGTSLLTSGTGYDGVFVTAVGSGAMTFNSGADVNATCGAVTGLSCQGDGLGIGDDEITGGSSYPSEWLGIRFSSQVSVSRIGFLDLFGRNTRTGDTAAETVQWVAYLGDGTQVLGSLTGTDTTTRLGWGTANTTLSNVEGIAFYATTPDSSVNSDFALASIEFSTSAIPEPTALLLLGTGLLGFVYYSRRR